MKRVFLIISFSIIAVCVKAQNNLSKVLEQPKLVVGLMVDQMRWDYLTRYANLYCEGGFRRLLREGYNCNRTYINYIPTITAVGHTSVYTGTVPAINGIVGNNFELNGNYSAYCTTDTTVRGVGTIGKDGNPDPNVWAGKNSPRNLLVTTITDQLRLATNFRSKTVGVAIKDRASILPAGHAANAAYWMDDNSMNFVTSTYYMDKLPQWAVDFNNRKLGDQYIKNLAKHNSKIKNGPWELLLDESKYVQSAPRGQRWENSIDGSLKQSPWGQTITFDMAMAAVEGEDLGNNPYGVPDFLAVSISSTDMIGHRLSPNSIFMEDTYLRLDRDLERFLNFLDSRVGKDNYLLFLTADHAGSHNREFKCDHNIPGELWGASSVKEDMEKHLKSQFPQFGKIVESMNNMQIHFSDEVRKSNNYNAVAFSTIHYLKNYNEVAYAFSFDAVPDYVPEPIRSRAINGYCPGRSGDIALIFKPAVIEDYSSSEEFRKPDHIYKGTTHSLWNPDDSHIPLVFMGWHINPAWDNQPHYIVDIAATIAALLNIQEPSGCIGQSIF